MRFVCFALFVLFSLAVCLSPSGKRGKMIIVAENISATNYTRIPAGWEVIMVRDHHDLKSALLKGKGYATVMVAMHGGEKGLLPPKGGRISWEHYNMFLEKEELVVTQISCRGRDPQWWDGSIPSLEGNIRFLVPKGKKLRIDLANIDLIR